MKKQNSTLSCMSSTMRRKCFSLAMWKDGVHLGATRTTHHKHGIIVMAQQMLPKVGMLSTAKDQDGSLRIIKMEKTSSIRIINAAISTFISFPIVWLIYRGNNTTQTKKRNIIE